MTGIEPVTYRLTVYRSDQTELHGLKDEHDGDRTHDPGLIIPIL